MQARTRAAVWMDRIMGSAALFGVSAVWFAAKLECLLPALLLAGGWTALMFYAVSLIKRRISGKRLVQERRAREQRAALYALTMLPYPEALAHAVQGLESAYSLSSLFTLGELHYVADEAHRRIAVRLIQCPQPATIAHVHDFHRERQQDYGVLICTGGVTAEAQAYAEALSPPVRLLDAHQLPLPEALMQSQPAKQAQKQRRAASILAMALRPTLTLRYVLLSILLLLVYLITDRLSALLPALALQLLALLSKGGSSAQEALF